MSELKSNAEWKQWGKDDPLWGVAAWANRDKSGTTPWTDEDFYALGESDWRDFLHHWQQYGLNTESCLEVGCGAGRMTKQLGRTFNRVYAVDVSEDMINLARRAVGANVEFSVIDGLHLPHADRSVKAVFSTHVLQHLDSVDIGLSYIRELIRVLDSGGTMMVHLPLYQFPSDLSNRSMMLRLYAFFRAVQGVRANLRRLRGTKIMRRTPYPISTLYKFLTGLGMENIEIRIFVTRINNDPHPFVLATKR